MKNLTSELFWQIRKAQDTNWALLSGAYKEAAILEAVRLIAEARSRQYRISLRSHRTPGKWLIVTTNCSYGDSPLTRLVGEIGLKNVCDMLVRELGPYKEFRHSRLRVSIGNQPGDRKVLVFKFLTFNNPAI